MLTTKNTVQGIRKINEILAGLVKAFPEHTHQQIAQLLVQKAGEHAATLEREIKLARQTGQNPWQKAGALARLQEYQPIIECLSGLVIQVGRPSIVQAVTENKQAA